MRTNLLVLAGLAILLLLVWMAEGVGQPPPSEGQGPKGKAPKGPPDEEKEIIKQIEEAYKAPSEVPEDVLKELRKAYPQPTPEREAKIFKELRRMYLLTAEREEAILREIRRAYDRPSAEQEERILREIRRADPLPRGTVPLSVQSEQARKLFLKLDLNGDGALSPDEMPEVLRGERASGDTNRDGFIDPDEYWAYYQARLGWLSEQVSSGQIQVKGGPTGTPGSADPTRDEKPPPAVNHAGKLPPGLPAWFGQLDTDADAQLGLYEWRKGGRPLQEFFGMDRNGDGFLTVDELMRHLAQQSPNGSGGSKDSFKQPSEGKSKSGKKQ